MNPSAFLRSLGLAPALMVSVVAAACTPSLYMKGETAISAEAPDVPPPPPCPTAAPKADPAKRVEVKEKAITIAEKIQFEQGKALIKKESHGLLDEIATVLKENPRIKKVSVEGHASADGDAKANKTLSDERAKAVVAYLTAKGVESTRLEGKGWGEEKPIADNKTEEGREKNRRVEFIIVAQDPPGPPPKVPPPAIPKPGGTAPPPPLNPKGPPVRKAGAR
ncbi:MAG: OmpA family protein [Polyangiaceae bacterium]